MAKLKVAILFGGKSGEHEVSIVSALSIYRALDAQKYDITLIGIDKTGRWVLPDQKTIEAHLSKPRELAIQQFKHNVSLLPYQTSEQFLSIGATPPLTTKKFDVILPILHGTYGEDGTIQGLLELANVPYVGSGVLGSSLCMDKEMAKKVLRDSDIPVVPFLTARKIDFEKNPEGIIQSAEKEFGYPYFIKPANMGSSVGVHKVKDLASARKLFKDAFQYDTKILIEQAIAAREIEIAVLGNYEPKASILGEIIPNHEFYSYEAKYIDEKGADLKIPAENVSKETVKKIQDYAMKAFQVLECYGIARIDFFLDKNTGEIYLNEVNTIPGFTSISMYPKLWEATGVPYSKLLDQLIAFALERHKARNDLKTSYEPAL